MKDVFVKIFRSYNTSDDATSDVDLRSPPSNHFEKLSGKLKDKCSIRVNNQWQLASAMGVSRRTVNELCTGKRSITVDTALMIMKYF